MVACTGLFLQLKSKMVHNPSCPKDSCTSNCSFEDGVKLVKIRGESMQAAANARPSGMVSVIGLDSDKAKFSTGLLQYCRPVTKAQFYDTAGKHSLYWVFMQAEGPATIT